ncbi:MAG: hypothetical protein JXC32_11490 [Anaerolineae bacterium]|nr:hypothetical protein [Anaerolineae bacterium]
MRRSRQLRWLGRLLIAGGLLCLAGCGARCPRNSVYRDVAAQLAAQGGGAWGLPKPEVVIPAQAEGCFGESPVAPVLAPPQASEILVLLDQRRPAYVLAGDDAIWEGVRHQRWFVDRYRYVGQWGQVYPELASPTLYAYAPSPFDLGETVPVRGRFETGSVVLRSYRLSSAYVEPNIALYLTLLWDDVPGGDYRDLTMLLRLVEKETGQVWYAAQSALAPTGLTWEPQFRLAQAYVIVPPDDLPEGGYEMRVGLQERSGRTVGVTSDGDATAADLLLAEVAHPPDVSRSPIAVEHSASYRFGSPQGPIALTGYDAPPWVQAGEELRVALVWSAVVRPPESYHVFVHLVDAGGNLVTQSDGVPVYGFYPTGEWRAGDAVRDVHTLKLPDTVPAGAYSLFAGLYHPVSETRLPVYASEGGALPLDQAPIHELTVYPQP